MNTIANKLPHHVTLILKRIETYIGLPLLYFGSVQRYDFITSKSDIDIDIFTPDVETTMLRLQHLLNVSPDEFKKIAWKLNVANKFVTGYKLMYKNMSLNPTPYTLEFSIYNEKYRDSILKEHLGKTTLPIHAVIMLYVLKLLHYRINVIPTPWFLAIKRYILSTGIGKKTDQFVTL